MIVKIVFLRKLRGWFPDLWKIPNKQEIADTKKRVAALKRSYNSVKTLGFKGSYTSFAKKIGAVEKPSYTFPGFGSGIDVHKAVDKLQNQRLDGHYQGVNTQFRITI